MESWFSRTELLLGEERSAYLQSKHVLIAGVGGVGAYAAEMLCRAGIGKMTIVDGDKVQPSNINRQLIALHSAIGKPKVDLLKSRLYDINPDLTLHTVNVFLQDERIPELLDADSYDFVIDAIDTLGPKVFLIVHALARDLRIISSMGAGGKIDPSQVRIADISDSYNCNLARFVRKRLHKMEVRHRFPVVFSTEQADKNAIIATDDKNKKSIVGTISYMPALFGCYLAAYVIRNL
ncbi:MAG: tRNA threonylcarbamoyladenosine dehydratase [Candidatus Azobacteroides sp.]|nr:tRNA threonylcarbamoyladenosine dehydratase [Candidatus Azobacteroides sp.]